MPPTVRRSLAACGILAPAGFGGAAIAGASAQGGYDSRREDLSALLAALYFSDALPAWSGVVQRAIAAVAPAWAAGVGMGVLRRGELAATAD